MSRIGACGDNCEFCHRYRATISRDSAELEKVKQLWVRIGLRDESFPAEQLACTRCHPNEQCGHKELLACGNKNRIQNCGQCKNYPCKIVSDMFDKTERWKHDLRHKCSAEEYELLKKAFCEKKANLDWIHSTYNKKNEKIFLPELIETSRTFIRKYNDEDAAELHELVSRNKTSIIDSFPKTVEITSSPNGAKDYLCAKDTAWKKRKRGRSNL